MPSKYFIYIVALALLLTECKKQAPINFNCDISGTTTAATSVIGNATTSYDLITGQPGYAFQISMSGPSSSFINLYWYNLDSVNAEKFITAKTYTIPNYSAGLVAPFSVGAVYAPQGSNVTQVAYTTGGGSGGTVTVTGNSGPGGTISGTFSFVGINTNNPYDTVRVTNGTFTNVPVASQ
jgi:hypothetical protein